MGNIYIPLYVLTHTHVIISPKDSSLSLVLVSIYPVTRRFLMPTLHLLRMPGLSSSSVEKTRGKSRIRPQNRQSVDCAKLARGASVRCPRKFVRHSWMVERGEKNLSNYSLTAMAIMILANCSGIYRFSTQILFPLLFRGLGHYTCMYSIKYMSIQARPRTCSSAQPTCGSNSAARGRNIRGVGTTPKKL